MPNRTHIHTDDTLGGDLTGPVLIPALTATGVTAGSYTNANLTVDAKGRITAASNGSSGGAAASDATSTNKGVVQLAGDLGGTAATPTVPGLAGKEPTVAAGTTSQYYRGDKTFQTLDKTAVGLANVDNTSDVNKPVSTAQQTALNAKQATLVSGTNIKTVNGNTLLGAGDLTIASGTASNATRSLYQTNRYSYQLENFTDYPGRWVFSGTGNITNGVLNVVTANGAESKATRTLWSEMLAGFDTITFDLNLNGFTFANYTDSPEFVLQDGVGYKYINLLNFATNGSNGWNTYTIPLSKFTANGDATSSAAGTGAVLNNTVIFYSMILRTYDTGVKTMSMRNIVLSDSTKTIAQDYTQPDLLSTDKLGNSLWRFQGVDIMKVTKDNMFNQASQTLMTNTVQALKQFNPTHVAVSTPYDAKTAYATPPVLDGSAYATKWGATVRAAGLKVFWRQSPIEWEGLYSVAKNTTRGVGTAAGVKAGTETGTYLKQIYDYIVANPQQYAPGDIISPIPEPENGGINGISGSSPYQFATAAAFRVWLRDAITVVNLALDKINLKGQVGVGFYGTSGFIVTGNTGNPKGFLDDRTIDAMGVMGMDDYPNPVSNLTTDLAAYEALYGTNRSLAITEFGTINDTTDAARTSSLATFLSILASKSYAYGFSYWTPISDAGASSNANENLLDKNSYALIGAGQTLINVFTSGGPSAGAYIQKLINSTVSSKVVDASTTTKGIVQLAGDLAGTASVPTVPGLANKVPYLTFTSTKTSAYTAVVGDYVLVDATAGSVTITLPLAAANQRIAVKKVDSSTNVVTVQATGSDKIGAQTATSLPISTQNESATYLGTAGRWQIENGHLSRPALDLRYALTFNVKNYGAVGDGTTNDYAAIQAAITAAQTAGGGNVYFPVGTYVTGGMPTVTTGNLVISGAGHGSKILLGPASMNASGTTIGIFVNGASNVIIRDLCIDGNFANIAKDGSYHASSTLWDPIRTKYGATSVKNYVMAGSGSIDATTYLKQRMPIRISNSQNVIVENCLIQNSVSAGIMIDGTSVNACQDILLTKNRIKLTWDNGIYFHQGVQYGTAIANEISDTTYNGVSTVFCDHILIANNNIRFAGPSDSDSGGIQINGSTNSSAVGNLIDQCQFYGIDILSTQETNIPGGQGGNSFWSSSTTVNDNIITNCRANDYPSHNAPGINIFGGDQNSIANNSISGCDFGISMGAFATNSSIVGNSVTKNKSIGINIGNSADVINTTIKSNYVAYNGSHGVFAYAPARYEGNTFIGNNGLGLSIAQPPSGLPYKIDYVVGNTILDNTDSGILTNGGAASVAIVERNTFGNSPGVLFNDGSVTYNSTTFTSASAGFVASDVGLPVFLINQGQYDTLTTTTISSVTNATTVVLANAAQSTQTGLAFYIGRGPAFSIGSTAGTNVLTAPAGTFKSTDAGKFITVMTKAATPVVIYTGSIGGYTSATSVTLNSAVTYTGNVQFILNRSQGQQARSINNYNDYPVIARNNSTIGTQEYLGGGGGVDVLPTVIQNLPAPTQTSDAATKSYTDGLDAGNVKTTGAQTIGGVKLFTSAPQITNDTGVTFLGGSGNATTIKVGSDGSFLFDAGSGVKTRFKLGGTTAANTIDITPDYTNSYFKVAGDKSVNTFNTTLDDGSGNIVLKDGATIAAGTTTGTKIGTANTQKIGFYNATPVSQQANTVDLGTVLSTLGIRAAGAAYPVTTSGAVAFTGSAQIGSGGLASGVSKPTATAMTLTTTSAAIQLMAPTANATVTLPASPTNGQTYTIKNTTTFTITISVASSGTIDGAASYTLASQYKYVTVVYANTTGVYYITANN